MLSNIHFLTRHWVGGRRLCLMAAFFFMSCLPVEVHAVINDAHRWLTGPPPDAVVGQPYSFWLKSDYGTREGGGPTYWQIEEGSLPPGLVFKGQKQNFFTGLLIEGVPTQAGVFKVRFIAQAFATSWWEASYTINVSPFPVPPVVSVSVLATNGSGVFDYDFQGLSGNPESISVNAPGIAVLSAKVHGGTFGSAAVVRQTGISKGWPANPAAISCADSNAAESHNALGNLASVVGNAATLPAAVMVDSAVIVCLFTNTAPSGPALDLRKEVRNISQGAAAFSIGNQARPGDLLEYRISYTNTAAETLTNLEIDDATPAFTSYVESRVGAVPPSLRGCTKTTPASASPVDCVTQDATGGRGAVAWRFVGTMPPGASGSVSFQVRVD